MNHRIFDYDKAHQRGYLSTLIGSYDLRISPDLAAKWLDLNPSNRPLSNAHILNLAKRMSNGEWMLNGQGLIFSSQGYLLDGQHRLSAIIKHGQPIEFTVVFGRPPESFKTLDNGRSRKAGDVLAIESVPNARDTASAIKKIIDFGRSNFGSNSGYLRTAISNSEILEWYRDNEGFNETVTAGVGFSKKSGGILTTSEFAFYLFLFSKIDEDNANLFLSRLSTGTDLNVSSPILHLRNKLVLSKFDNQKKLIYSVKLALVLKAWSLFLKGKEIKSLRFNSEKEKFPALNLCLIDGKYVNL